MTTVKIIKLFLHSFQKQPDYSYFSYAVLLMEKKYEESLGVWERMTSKLALKPKMPIDAAYKVFTLAVGAVGILFIPRVHIRGDFIAFVSIVYPIASNYKHRMRFRATPEWVQQSPYSKDFCRNSFKVSRFPKHDPWVE